MIFNVSGGGGAAMNFRVVGGTTAPTTPAVNCIWVNTNVEITSWIFSATEPRPAEAGMIWIYTSTSSIMEFNALKKNAIQVYPISAKQYINGAWVDKTAKSYQGGEWVDWIMYLFKDGDQFENITGGLKGYAYKAYTSGAIVTTPTVSITDVVRFSVGGNTSASALFVENPVDLTPFTKLTINITEYSALAGQVYMIISTNKANNYNYVALTQINGTGLHELQIGDYDGAYYCAISLDGSGAKTIAFDEWRLS